MNLSVLGKIPCQQFQVNLVLLRCIEDFQIVADDFERLWIEELLFIFEIVINFESGRKVVEGLVELDEFHLLLLSILDLAAELGQSLGLSLVGLS